MVPSLRQMTPINNQKYDYTICQFLCIMLNSKSGSAFRDFGTAEQEVCLLLNLLKFDAIYTQHVSKQNSYILYNEFDIHRTVHSDIFL